MRPRTALAFTLPLLLAIHAAAQAPGRSSPPVVGEPPDVDLPVIRKHVLGNGLSVWIVERHEVPVVQVNLIVRGAGTAADPLGQFGVASLTAAMLVEGAGGRSSLELADAVDFLGASLSASSGVDSAAIRLYAPVARVAEALPILWAVATSPTFPGDELERLRQERLTGLLQARDDPEAIASLALSRVLYGPTHRFGIPMVGTDATLASLTREDLQRFYASKYRPETAVLLVVGDVHAEAFLPLVHEGLGSWEATGEPQPGAALRTPPPRARREVYLIDRAGAPQSQIRIGLVGVPRSTPDYFPIQVMNTVLGGSFTSRLNMNLRERNGYAYGAGSFFDMREDAGPFTASAAVQTDKTAAALVEFFKELDGMLKPIPEDELERARSYLALRYPAGFETTADISRRLEELFIHRLPEDYFATFVRNIQSVTAGDVQRAARSHIEPAESAIIVVGDRKAIEPEIRALDLGPVNFVTVDELFSTPR